jgi:short-subunit dehydrogenase
MAERPKPGRDTALVTGASGGIGEELARGLASRGHDLVLLARSAEKLKRLAQDLEQRHSVRVEWMSIDLATPDSPGQVQRFVESKERQVDLLINNAGFGTFGPFAESELAAELGQIQLNVVTLTQLTRAFLPAMVRRGRGGILNVASTAAFQPGPLMSVYYATKAYVLSFSLALANELKGTGVTVTCLCPGPTRTGFMERARMPSAGLLGKKGVMMDASRVAAKGLHGLVRGRALVIPGLLNRMLVHSTRLGSRELQARVVRRILDGIRASAPRDPE